MTATVIGRFEPGSPEWHQARAAGIGGSEVAAVLGLSPYESRFSLWHRKTGQVGPVEETPVMEWGKRLEPVILDKFREEHPELQVVPSATYSHPDRPWQIANPDAECESTGDVPEAIVEVKTARVADGWGEPGSDEVPVYYRVQCLWYLDVLGVEVCWVPVLIGGSDYREYRVTYDDAEALQIRSAVALFLDDLHTGIRPDIDEHSATYQAIRDMHPDIEPVDHPLDGDIATEYVLAKAAEKAAKAATQRATSAVADAMGNAARAVWDDTTIARRQAKGDGAPYVVAGRGLEKVAAAITEGNDR